MLTNIQKYFKSEEVLEYLILHETTWIDGDINNNKKGYTGHFTKNTRMYVREMKSKYNKEYEHLNFDETIEQKQNEEINKKKWKKQKKMK